MAEICIIGMARTPTGGFGGSLQSLTAPQLGTLAIKKAIERSGISVNDVDEVFMGNVVSAGQGQAPARQAALDAGIPVSVPCTTVNKVCASGMKATALGCMSIITGDSQVVVTGGFESMTNIPFYSKTSRFGHKYGDVSLIDGLANDGLRDRITGEAMGCCAVLCAAENNISREEQDRYAAASYQRAVDATKAGKFDKEMFPIEIKKRGKKIIVDKDEEAFARPVNYESLSKLPPAFTLPKAAEKTLGNSPHKASVTAGSSSTISDGASALVLCSRAFAAKHKLPVLAVIESFADSATDPEHFPIAPASAMEKALKKCGRNVSEVDFFEVNEAFALVPIIAAKKLNVDLEKMNIYGGGLSLGHAIGSSGARIICTMVSALMNENKSVGCLGICNGGGGAGAMVIRRDQTSKL